jgi:hypothetical protein
MVKINIGFVPGAQANDSINKRTAVRIDTDRWLRAIIALSLIEPDQKPTTIKEYKTAVN